MMPAITFGALMLAALGVGLLIGFDIGRRRNIHIHLEHHTSIDWDLVQSALEGSDMIAVPKTAARPAVTKH